ncbi:MAG: hypothetical protein ACE37F_15730 [Nannocystaceae bacterium]|nr:hypothetical protein [bacterium]
MSLDLPFDRRGALFAAVLVCAACGADEETPSAASEGGQCQGAKCDEGGESMRAALEGRSDPIARYLLAELEAGRLSDDGFLPGDYETVLMGLAEIQGCDESSIRTFVVSDTLLSETPFPRIVSTVCSGNKAAEFFISAPESDGEGGLELQFIEMFAFDKDADEYVFYETFPTEDEAQMVVNPSPTRCQQCHLTPSDHSPDGMRMTPIMNELNQPWTHWNGEPGFVSHSYHVDDEVKDTDGWFRVVEPYLAPAAEFEKIIRRGHFLAAKERRKDVLRGPVDAIAAMNLMRPLFCSEQIHYATAKGGQVLDSVILDPALGQRLVEMNIEAPWYKPAPNNLLQLQDSATLEQVPIRGNADQLLENQLISRGLTSEDILRVRAIAWHKPVFSGLRCEMWTDAYRRYDGGGAPNLSGASEMEEALPIILRDILGELVTDPGGAILAIGGESDEELRAAFTGEGMGCAEDGVGACFVTPDELSAMVGRYKASFEDDPGAGERIQALRDERICAVTEQAPVEQLPTAQRSGRFTIDADIDRCAQICCGREGIEPDEEDVTWLSCASDVENAITDTLVRNEEPWESCALECGLPTRYANRPALPVVEGCEPPNFVWPFGLQ